MVRRVRDERDAFVERLAQKLDTVPPRRETSGIYPAKHGDDADQPDPGARLTPAPRAPRVPSELAVYGERRSAVGNLDDPF